MQAPSLFLETVGFFRLFFFPGVSGFADVFSGCFFPFELDRKQNLDWHWTVLFFSTFSRKTVKMSSNLHFVANADTGKPPSWVIAEEGMAACKFAKPDCKKDCRKRKKYNVLVVRNLCLFLFVLFFYGLKDKKYTQYAYIVKLAL